MQKMYLRLSSIKEIFKNIKKEENGTNYNLCFKIFLRAIKTKKCQLS